MERNYTHEQIATDFRLWAEYFDTCATMTEAEFDAMTVEAKVTLLDAAQIAQAYDEAVVTIGNWTGAFVAARNLMDDELAEDIRVATPQEFCDAYVAAHAAKYDGEEFVVN